MIPLHFLFGITNMKSGLIRAVHASHSGSQPRFLKRGGRIEAGKLLLENDMTRFRGGPRCRQSVYRIVLILEPSHGIPWCRIPRLTEITSNAGASLLGAFTRESGRS